MKMMTTFGFFVSPTSREVKSKARMVKVNFSMINRGSWGVLLSGKKTVLQGLKFFPSLFP